MIIKYCSNSQEKENRELGEKGENKKMANLIYNISIITLNIKGLNEPLKDRFEDWIKK